MKKYRKQLLLLVGVVSLFLPSLVSGGNNNNLWSVDLMHQRRHQFGVSVSTALYDGLRTHNPYLYPVEQCGVWKTSYSLHTVNSSYGSISLNYQFRFNDAWSIETKLKYRQRAVQFQLWFPDRDLDGSFSPIYGFSTSGYIKYGDLSLPITVDYRWISSMKTGIELFGGMGLSTAGLVQIPKKWYLGTADFRYNLLAVEIEYSRNFFVYGIVGAQFDIPFGRLSLKPFITYSFYPNNICRYTLTPRYSWLSQPDDNPYFDQGGASAYMKMHELECGLTIQF